MKGALWSVCMNGSLHQIIPLIKSANKEEKEEEDMAAGTT